MLPGLSTSFTCAAYSKLSTYGPIATNTVQYILARSGCTYVNLGIPIALGACTLRQCERLQCVPPLAMERRTRFAARPALRWACAMVRDSRGQL